MRPPVRRVVWRTLAALCALAVAATIIVGRAHAGSSGAPTRADVTKLLVRRDAAVAAHSQAAFLDDVDPSAVATAFRTRQSDTFQALTQLPLATWHETVASPVTDPQSTAAAARRYGAAALIVDVQLSYQLRGIDQVPSTHDMWWTFVRRDGRVVVAGDDDLALFGGASWRGPWDFGPLATARGAASIVLAPAGQAGQASAIASEADRAVTAVSRVWTGPWPGHVAMIVASLPAELSAFASAAVTADASAVTVSDPRDAVTGTLPGLRVVLNPARFDVLTATGRDIVLRHEITHVATSSATGLASPRWLVEGMAEYVANLGTGMSVAHTAAELRAAVVHGRVPTALPPDADLEAGATSAQAYEQAWLACRLIAARAGQGGLVRFYRLVGASADTSAAAVAAAIQSVLHESSAAFTTAWRAYLVEQLK
jgi:hypothetical protein